MIGDRPAEMPYPACNNTNSLVEIKHGSREKNKSSEYSYNHRDRIDFWPAL